MAQHAVEESAWVAVDTWEASQPLYVRTVYVLRSIEEEVNHALRGECSFGGAPVRVVLQCGADMLAAMNDPKAWDHKLLHELLSSYEVVCVGRDGVDSAELTKQGTILHGYTKQIHFIEDPFANEVSSSRVRAELASGRPVDYIIPAAVLRYIREEALYGAKDIHEVG
jgi:nicotinamide mononucleotide adenylyltransferase